ncbi:anti-sigma-F factor Fin family protein [Cohnella silvisoli]|uniref:Anti-sigma-F factor Fin family protein n=1 Tax=Cohnella silvisoli TaxID=2873699 RepID=A0ABV1L3R5_9BACL|nr:anti-sigma-F factor Fin family protein [Cohnella silvisoli]MCD9026271.1 anti-sigma-F factor Fin family protein [Cohnella silvisoli]
MAVNYICRHCSMSLGRFEDGEVPEYRLGLHFLTPEERKRIIAYNSNGDVTVRVICEYCSQTLDAHPELALLSNPLQ